MENRTRSVVAALALAVLSGCGGMAGGPDDMGLTSVPAPAPVPRTPEDRLVAAIEANDCVLTASNVEPILLQASLTQAELAAIVPDLAAAGRAEVAATGTIRVLTDNCI